ncbi:MAG: zinc-finger-containing protein [Bacteroidota bacterium]
MELPLSIKNTAALISSGKLCPYCEKESEFVDSAAVYGTSYGMIYICRPCQAWVGVHEGTDQALGRLADYELRQLKILAHRWFDPIAIEGLINEFYTVYIAGITTRQKAYHWLASELSIQPAYCHIGMFDVEECKQVIAVCQPIVERYENSGDII